MGAFHHGHPLALARLSWAALLVVSGVAPALGFEGRYRVEGQELDGSTCKGLALVDERDGATFRVQLKTVDPQGAERRVETRATLGAGGILRWSQRAVRQEFLHDPPLSALARLDPAAAVPTLRVIYRDEEGKQVRRELWVRDDAVVIPVAVVGLLGSEGFARGVTAEQAKAAQGHVVEQLGAAYRGLGVSFVPAREEGAWTVEGAGVDKDKNGRLGREEVAALRDELERAGVKRPGRVVLVITGGGVVGRGCRGLTLGDAPRTPTSLRDFNDNFSLVGLRYLDASRYHTVPHEVGHQLGLDDVVRTNRSQLRQPDREDHLMLGGGIGTHIDPAAAELLLKAVRQPDHGLLGRRTPLTLDFGDEERGDLTPR